MVFKGARAVGQLPEVEKIVMKDKDFFVLRTTRIDPFLICLDGVISPGQQELIDIGMAEPGEWKSAEIDVYDVGDKFLVYDGSNGSKLAKTSTFTKVVNNLAIGVIEIASLGNFLFLNR